MAALINISGLTPVVDPAYRYKMPRIMGKVEGRGNGIKTVLMNVTDVATSLNREAPEITKFFGCELGAQTTYAPDRAIVNGSHRDSDLQTNMHKYIENFVLCKKCRLPETHYKVKDGLISQKCLACGNKDTVDMTHKLTTFILAQHKLHKKMKEKDDKAAGKDKEKDKKDKEKEKDKSEKKKDKKDKSSEDDKEKKEKKSKKKERGGSDEGENEEVPENVFGITGSGDGEGDDEESDKKAAEDGMERYKLFRNNQGTDLTIPLQLEELRNIQTMASLRPADRIIIFLGAVFTDEAITINEIALHTDMLKALAPSDIQQRHLLAAFEWFCGSKYPPFNRLFSKVLMQLYEAEIVEEDVFLAWAGDTTRNEFTADESMIDYETLETLRNHAFPFIKWLQEAEEEGEEEDDDEDEDDDDEEEDDDA